MENSYKWGICYTCEQHKYLAFPGLNFLGQLRENSACSNCYKTNMVLDLAVSYFTNGNKQSENLMKHHETVESMSQIIIKSQEQLKESQEQLKESQAQLKEAQEQLKQANELLRSSQIQLKESRDTNVGREGPFSFHPNPYQSMSFNQKTLIYPQTQKF